MLSLIVVALHFVFSITIDGNKKFSVIGLFYSPITGPEGNIEYLLYLNNDAAGQSCHTEQIISDTVEAAHKNLT